MTHHAVGFTIPQADMTQALSECGSTARSRLRIRQMRGRYRGRGDDRGRNVGAAAQTLRSLRAGASRHAGGGVISSAGCGPGSGNPLSCNVMIGRTRIS